MMLVRLSKRARGLIQHNDARFVKRRAMPIRLSLPSRKPTPRSPITES